MPSQRAGLALRVLDTLAGGNEVTFNDAVQLRNWANTPEDALLPLGEIARRVLSQEENKARAAGEQD